VTVVPLPTAWQVWAKAHKDLLTDAKAELDIREYTAWVQMVRVWATNEEFGLELEALDAPADVGEDVSR
jgi:hypothetical protein